MKNCFRSAVIVTAALSAMACHKATPKPRAEAVPVTVAVAAVHDLPVQLSAIGNVQPFSNVAVKALVGGNLERVWFREGEDVHKGQLLFTIDPRPLQADLAQAQANLARDEANLRNAESEASRYAGLVKKDYVTREEYDKYTTGAAAARAVAAADRAAVESARLQFSYAEIRAPMDGRTGGLMVHPGNIIRANDTTPLVVINQVRPIYVQFSIPEAQLPSLRARMQNGALPVIASPQAGGAALATGKLTFVDNAVDPTTGTITLKGTFDNGNNALWPGQFVNVAVTLQNIANAVVIPTQAVQTGQKGLFVFVVKQDKSVEMRPVTVAQSTDQQSVISRGVAGGETVVTDGQLRLTPKSKVQVKQGV
jgi:multidrug efflux system membrane fusion protein